MCITMQYYIYVYVVDYNLEYYNVLYNVLSVLATFKGQLQC